MGPGTLLVVGRSTGGIEDVVVAGPGTFLNEMLELAGGTNAVGGEQRWPQLNAEAIVLADPEVIIEFSSDSRDATHALWKAHLPALKAVRDARVHTLDQSGLLIPGPRMPETARALVEVLWPKDTRPRHNPSN